MENTSSQRDADSKLTVVLVTPDMAFRQQLDEKALLSAGCKYVITDQAAADAFLAKLKTAIQHDAGNVSEQDFDVRYKLTFRARNSDSAIEHILMGPYKDTVVGLIAGFDDKAYAKSVILDAQILSDVMQLVRVHGGLTQPAQRCDAYILEHYK